MRVRIPINQFEHYWIEQPDLPDLPVFNSYCRHMGVELETVPCPGASCRTKTWSCNLHSRCHRNPGKDFENISDCTRCKDRQEHEKLIEVICTANGIGDAILGLPAISGLKRDNPTAIVCYSMHHDQLPWVSLFSGYDYLTTQTIDDAKGLRPFDKSGVAGKHKLAEFCGTTPAKFSVKPLPDDALQWARQFTGTVILAPRSLHSSRSWLMSHWLRLEQLLTARGFRCVVIDSEAYRSNEFLCEKIIGRPATYIAALMLASECVVANDSGMAHLAGALGVPTVVAIAQLKGEEIMSNWSSVRWVTGKLKCSGCNFNGQHWREMCDSLCASLQTIEPGDMAAAVDRVRPMSNFLNACLDASGKSPLVIETGCQREAYDWGAGMSTTIFGRWLKQCNGKLISIDLSPSNVKLARMVTTGLPVEVIQSDSRKWLNEYTGQPIAGIYLDSADVGTPNFEKICLEEAIAVLQKLLPNAPILIDDTKMDGNGWNGKGRLTVPFLIDHGWRVAYSGHQQLLLPTNE